MSEASKAQLIELYETARDPLAGKSADEKRASSKRTSYRDYLTKICGCSEEVANCFQGRTLDFFGLGMRRRAGRRRPRSRLSGLRRARAAGRRQRRPGASPTSIISPTATRRSRGCWCARSFRRVAPGNTMDDIVLAPFDYGKLDRRGQPVRIRLDAPASTSATSGDERRARLCPRRQAAPRRGARMRCSPAST